MQDDPIAILIALLFFGYGVKMLKFDREKNKSGGWICIAVGILLFIIQFSFY